MSRACEGCSAEKCPSPTYVLCHMGRTGLRGGGKLLACHLVPRHTSGVIYCSLQPSPCSVRQGKTDSELPKIRSPHLQPSTAGRQAREGGRRGLRLSLPARTPGGALPWKAAASSPSWGPAAGLSLLGLRRGQGEGEGSGKSLHLPATVPCWQVWSSGPLLEHPRIVCGLLLGSA